MKNLARDPRVTLLFESGETYEELKGVQIRARAELHKDVDTVHRLHMDVLLRNTPELGEEVIRKASAAMAPKKTAIVIKPEKLITWDHSKL